MREQIWIAHCGQCGNVKSITSLSGQRCDVHTTTDPDQWVRCWSCGMIDARRTAGLEDQVIRRLILDGATRALDHLEETKSKPLPPMRPGTNIPEDWSALLDEAEQYGVIFAAFEFDSQDPGVREHVLGIVRGALDEMRVAHRQPVGA